MLRPYHYCLGRIQGPGVDLNCVNACTKKFAQQVVALLNEVHQEGKRPLVSPPPRKPHHKAKDPQEVEQWQNKAGRMVLKLLLEASAAQELTHVTARALTEYIGGGHKNVMAVMERLRENGLADIAWHGKLRIGWILTERGKEYAEQQK